MIRSCKHVDITDPETISPWVYECMFRHYKRRDFGDILVKYGMDPASYRRLKRTDDKTLMFSAVGALVQDMARMIREHDLSDLTPVSLKIRYDHTTFKERLIGCECALQQCFDYIAVRSSKEVWDRRMVIHQMSSIEGRGQILGTKILARWVREDNRAERYARKHGLRYSRKCKYFVKLDVAKCFPSSRLEIFMDHFRKDCANRDIVWLWEQLLKSHRVQGYTGFMIGSLVSQWASQYLMSWLYRFAMDVKIRGRKTVSHMMLFMDDMCLFSSSRSGLKQAIRKLVYYSQQEIGYRIKPKWHIYSIDDVGVDMMGFVVHGNGKVTIRSRNYIKARRLCIRAMKAGRLVYGQAQRLLSYKGFFRYSNSENAERMIHYRSIMTVAQSVVGRHDRRVRKRHAAA